MPTRDLEQKILELTTLHEISKVLTDSLDLKVTCRRVLKLLSQMLGMERGTFLLREGESRRLSIVAAHGMTHEEIQRGKYRVGEGVVGSVIASGSPIVIPSIGDEPLFLDRTRSREGIPRKREIAFICVPVRLGGEVVGVLTVDRVFSEEVSFDRDVRFLSIVSGSIAQAVRIGEMVRAEKERLLEENRDLKAELKGRYRYENIVGSSDRMQEVFASVERVAGSAATVMLRGESGTGKELIARAIHYNSPRSKGPFHKLNCAALPEALLESELFGHEKGAFTGAVGEKKGRFELAHGGTLFLDEIGDIPPSFQVKMLRALQERQFERVGGTRTITVDVRLIAATNRDLEEAVREGAFREDLYYRLNVIPLFLPPLRERLEDMPLLIDFFLDRFNGRNGKAVRLPAAVLDRLLRHSWPGNVRELENAVEHVVTMARGEKASEEDLPPYIRSGLDGSRHGGASASTPPSPEAPAFRGLLPQAGTVLPSVPPHPRERWEGVEPVAPGGPSAIEAAERRMIEEALARAGGVQSRAALLLGLTSRQIGYKIRKHGIDPGR
jgi:Nif-specific regulatory protein